MRILTGEKGMRYYGAVEEMGGEYDFLAKAPFDPGTTAGSARDCRRRSRYSLFLDASHS